jgi:hypothetical protein
MPRKKKTARKRAARPSKKKSSPRKKPAAITVRRSSGRKEKFDLDRMSSTTSRSGVPFLMARDVAKNVSKQIKSEAKGKIKKTVTAGRVRQMIASELRDRNEKTIASSYAGEAPENTQRDMSKANPHKSPIGTADKDQHNAYRADRDSVLHDRSKRLKSAP